MNDKPAEPETTLLPWYPLGALTCLMGASPHRPSSVPLLTHLAGLPTDALNAACAVDQPYVGVGGLVDVAYTLSLPALKPFYRRPWTGPSGFPLRIRRPGKAHGLLYLTRTALVLAWPVDGDIDADGKRPLDQALAAAHGGFDPVRSIDLEQTCPDGLWLDAFMKAADEAVTTRRHDFESQTGLDNDKALAWISREATSTYGYEGPSYPGPDRLRVAMDLQRDTRETAWDVQSRALTLRLGWVRSEDKAMLFDQWPCGCFGGP